MTVQQSDPPKFAKDAGAMFMQEELQLYTHKWYFSRSEIEDHSPSRKDGIDIETESKLQKLFCSFIQELGMKLKVPQVTIASALMLCYRFFMRQSHAKNDWQRIGTAGVFLACKSEETLRPLRDVVIVSYEMMYKWDPSSSRRIRQREVYDKQKELILVGERLLLVTIGFDLNIQHPYQPLVAALKRLEISHNNLVRVAWNFVNDWLSTTLCLQYKPHYIAAGSLFLAAKFNKLKLSTEKGRVWWLQFDVSPKVLEEVIQQMLKFLEKNRKQACLTESTALVKKAKTDSTESCILSGSTSAADTPHRTTLSAGGLSQSVTSKCTQNITREANSSVTDNEALPSWTSDCGSADSIIRDVEGEIEHKITGTFDRVSSCKIVKIDVNTIRAKLKRRRGEVAANMKLAKPITGEIHSDEWIERELESGLEQDSVSQKR